MKEKLTPVAAAARPNSDLTRRFPETLEICNFDLLYLGNLLVQTLVGDVLKVSFELIEVDDTGAEKVPHKSLEGDGHRSIICNTHHLPEPLKLR